MAVNKLCVPLASITGAGLEISVTVPGQDLRPQDAATVPIGLVTVAGRLFMMGEEYVFQGRISGAYAETCDRCLEEIEMPLEAEIFWTFFEGLPVAAPDVDTEEMVEDGELEGAFTIEGDSIDLAPYVWEQVVLDVPSKFLCKEDCAGLCPACGANLNREQCGCRVEEEIENKALAGLADIFPDLKPERPKE